MTDTDFLISIITAGYPVLRESKAKPEPAPTCEWCGEVPPEGETLVEVDDSDPSVGYHSTILICANCRYRQGIKKRNPYSTGD